MKLWQKTKIKKQYLKQMYSKLQANTSIFIIRETAHKSNKALELG